MIPFKGRLKFKQRMPMKPLKYGIKLYEVYESRTRYCSQFSVYLRKQGGDDDNEGDLGKTGKVVVSLTKAFQHKGYKLFIDNFYTFLCYREDQNFGFENFLWKMMITLK